MPRTTQLFSYHRKHAQLTEFAGYEMPLWYTTTSEEHLAVRNSSGIFDVSHMGRVEIKGTAATSFLEGVVPTAVKTQPPGKAFYTLLLNERGGIIDDLIIMRLSDEHYVLVVNAANKEADLSHLRSCSPGPNLEIADFTSASVMIAVQGPKAAASLQPLADLDLSQLKRFRFSETRVLGNRALVSRTGYTGEDGFEVILFDSTNDNPEKALRVWEGLAHSSSPCGLGARDSLRLEAGFPLHGVDIDPRTNPFEADLSWVISAGKGDYVGSKALSESKSPPDFVRRGIVLGRGIPRHGFDVLSDSGKVGVVTSGTFSPILRRGIALGRMDQNSSGLGAKVRVMVRDSEVESTVVKPPFYDEQAYGWRRRSNDN